MTIQELCKFSHDVAKSKGFWASEKGISGNTNLLGKDEMGKDVFNTCNKIEERNNGELIALMHSELSECLEALRHNNPKSEHIPNFTSEEEEMSDLFIRAGDYCEAKGLRIEEAIKAKMAFNKGRPRKHGKSF